MLITDRHRAGPELFPILNAALDGGIDILQIREKDLSSEDLLIFGRDIIALVEGRATVVVNSDVAVAASLGAGLHLPERFAALNPREHGRLASGALVGRSTHGSLPPTTELLDYLLYGHVFSTASKAGLPPRGLEHLAAIAAASPLPIWAVGGIDASNAASVIRAGAAGVAVIGALLNAADPGEEVCRIRAAMDAAHDVFGLTQKDRDRWTSRRPA